MNIVTLYGMIVESIKNDLDKIQNKAARIATGATKLVSLNALSKKYVGSHLSKDGKITDLLYFIKYFIILLHYTCSA